MQSKRHSTKVPSTTVGNSIIAMVMTYDVILPIFPRQHGIQCMSCFPLIISEMLPEIRMTEKCDFL